MRSGPLFACAASMAALVACAATVPKAELDRCKLGVADGNDGMALRQGAACASVARHLAADDQATAALGYARKACDLEDARGCEEYLALARGQPGLGPDDLQRARSAGEKACAGLVLAVDGADLRASICARAAELYQDVHPASSDDAARLYARACRLGDERSCQRARSVDSAGTLGGRDEGATPGGASGKGAPNAPAAVQALPPAGPRPAVSELPAHDPPCHEMRACVSLDVSQRNLTETVGTITNRCGRAVTCMWCPAYHGQVDRSFCHSATLAPNEKRTGREAGLWYDGFNAIAYDCAEASDPRGCVAP
jgi:hypothetical protein